MRSCFVILKVITPARSSGLKSDEINLYIRTPSSYTQKGRGKKVPIPQKFKFVDTDNDGYISFDEMLKAIDNYFDFKSSMSASDVYDLNDFFFSQ